MTVPSGPIRIICGYDSSGNVKAVSIDDDGYLQVSVPGLELTADSIEYTAAVDADWNAGGPPVEVASGLDELAERTTDLETDISAVASPQYLEWDYINNGVVTGNALAILATASQKYQYAHYQNTAAINDKTQIKFSIGAGTYILYALAITGSNRGQVYIQHKHVDDAGWTVAVNYLECYSPSTVYNVMLGTAIFITKPGPTIFQFVVPSKNASSSGYYVYITRFYLRLASYA